MSIEGQGIYLSYIFRVLYVLCLSWPRYQVSVYRTIGPLVSFLSEFVVKSFFLQKVLANYSVAGFRMKRCATQKYEQCGIQPHCVLSTIEICGKHYCSDKTV